MVWLNVPMGVLEVYASALPRVHAEARLAAINDKSASGRMKKSARRDHLRGLERAARGRRRKGAKPTKGAFAEAGIDIVVEEPEEKKADG